MHEASEQEIKLLTFQKEFWLRLQIFIIFIINEKNPDKQGNFFYHYTILYQSR